MGKLDKVKSTKKSTICYIITIVVLTALTIGFLVAFIKERNKQPDIPKSDSTGPSSSESSVGTTPLTSSPSPTPTDLRLNPSVLPIHYDLIIEANHQTDRFEGQVKIKVNVSKTTDHIKIHSYLLDVKDNITLADDKEHAIALDPSYEYHNDTRQYWLIRTRNSVPLDVGYYYLSLWFNGNLTGKIIGFYKSNYTNSQNQIRQFSATKFEPTYARQAFPCFDEPNMKSTYSISIIHDKSLKAISNGIQIDRKGIDDNRVKTVFSKTVRMSTYLVAFVISDFQYKQSSTVRGKTVRVFSSPDQVANTEFALNTAIKVLEYYEKFFKIDYPLEKLDLVALPVFVSGAMENWGIITFRETNLLYSREGSSTSEMKRVAAVIAHELAHMWFGNLVTMDWWDDLWLNEGFASYIEYRGENASEPNWKIDQFFLNDDLHGVMRLDALDTSHPIIQTVENPNQITEIFDTISYSKGSSVLRMLEYAIGADVFQEGVIHYINEHLYENAKTQDLWNSIQKSVEKKSHGKITNVTEFMDPWTKEKGFPVVNVKRVSTNEINVKQKKFLLSSEQNLVKEEANVWPIYLTLISENGQGDSFLFDKIEDTIILDKEISNSSWIKFNLDQSGFYLVNYEPEDWKLLISLLKNNRDDLSPVDRANLIFDASMLAESGQLDYTTLFDLLSYVKNEDNLIPWLAAQSSLNRINDKFDTSGGGLAMNQFIKELTQNIYSSLRWQFEDNSLQTFQQKILRSHVLSMACSCGNEDCLKEVEQQFRQFMSKSDQKIDPNIREYVYKYGMKSGSSDDWNKLWNLWRTEVSATERTKLLTALTSVQKDTSLLSKLIQYSNDSTIINDQDFFTVQQSIASNTFNGRQLVWEYLRNNWDVLLNRFTSNDRRLGTYVSSVCSGFNKKTQLKEMEDFFAANPDSGAGHNARNQALERVKNNIEWINTYEEPVGQWLDNNTQTLNPWLNWRLSSSVIPKAYVIDWNVDLNSDKFNGSVIIEVEVKDPINYFILHEKGLQITESVVYPANIKTFKNMKKSQSLNTANDSFAYESNEFWVIPTDKTLRPSTYVLNLEFNGNLSTGLYGLYKSVYTDANNESKSLATTQFESTYARRAVPCFDEPQFKSTFNITVTHSSEYNVLSNMPITDSYTVSDSNTTVTKFDTSVKMVTYLLALVVSDFECFTSSVDKRVRVCAAPGNQQKLDYALDITPKILKFYEKDYFKIDYPLPKLDNIAIPDFSAGAMENWGLVTYREVYLFYDELESSTRDQMRVAMIISHELAHMWFGNLVTTKWWDDLWLNEGFATYMSYKAVAQVESQWRYDEIFALDELGRVFEADSTPNTRSILSSVQNADDISSVFDAITYGKGASILRMLESAMGTDNFRTGINKYLKKKEYQTALTADLWAELTEAHPERLNVSNIMNSWVKRKGFPVININRSTSPNERITLKQELFLKDSSNTQTPYYWTIPVTYRAVADKTVYTEWLDESQKTVTLKTDSDLIKFNVNQMGLFIVNYPTNDWKKWSKELNDEKSKVRQQLLPLDRSELINDAFYLARSGRLDYELALNLSQYLRYEDSLIPWTTAQTMFSYIKGLIYSDADIALNYYINDIIAKQYQTLGWDDTVGDAQKRRLRTVIIDMACAHQLDHCIDTAKSKFNEWKIKGRIAPNLLPLVLKYGIHFSNHSDDFSYLKDRYNNSNSAQEKLIFLQGLTSTTNPYLIQDLLNSSSDESFVRKHDYFTLLTNIALNSRTGAQLVWNYFRENYEEIEKRFTINNSNLGRIVYTLSKTFTNETQKQEVLDFFKKYPKAGAGKLDREKAMEVLDTNIKWLKDYKNKVIEWITNQCPKEICPWIVYRLNNRIVPTQYYLTIQVNTTNNIFNGSVNIEVEGEIEIEYFIVHSSDILDVTEAKVFDKTNEKYLSVKKMFRYSPLQFLVLQLDEKQSEPKNYILEFEFNSNLLLGGLSGLYKSSYEIDGKSRGLAATQFQSTSARKAFPCFDEPSFRSTFDVTLIHDEFNNLTLSNMPVINNETDPITKWTTTKYNKTVPMVTYLLALLVSDFACRSDNTSHSYEINVCSSPVKEYKLQYALDMTPKIFTAFEEYLNYSYQLPKSDLIAIPDFSAGAMENWGLVKFRETALLWTQDEDMSSNKMSVNSIIAHELAHMWFGNLLTCEFWGDLWLNEGFASFMEYPATNFSEPEWNYWDTFVYYDTSSALSSDSSPNSAPIVRQILKPSDMSYSSAIVYNKGSTIIRMMKSTMGDNNFQNGIRQYLEKHEYQTVVTKNLWDSLNETFPSGTIDTNIYELMKSWTEKAGYPYINITKNENNSLTIIQERFLSNGQKPAEDTLWTIPLSYYTTSNYKNGDKNIIAIKSKEQNITDLPSDHLIKFNVDFNGMYFVNYPLEDWDKWISALINNTDDIIEKLTPSDRSDFILSAFYLAKANKLPLLKAYNLSKYMVNEDHFTPWALFNSVFDNRYRLAMTQYKDSLNTYMSYLTSLQYHRLGWNDTEGDELTKRLRSLIVELSCTYGNQTCLNDAYKEFKKWKSGQLSLPPNLRDSILEFGIRQSNNSDDFEYVWDQYLNTNSSLKTNYLTALTFSADKNLLKGLLERSLDDRLVSVNNFVSVIQSMVSNSDGLPIVWQFFKDNYQMLIRKLSSSQLSTVFDSICQYIGESVKRVDVENFLKLYPNVGLSNSSRENSLNKIKANIDWIYESSDTIGQWLAENGCGPEPCAWSVYRLNPNIKPIKYYPTIQVNVTTNVYNGSVAIEVKVMEPIRYFIVHASSILNVTEARVRYNNSNKELPILKTFRYKPNDFYIIQLKDEILDIPEEGVAFLLEYEFNGNLLSGGLSGLYRSNYINSNNETIGLASTQFEFTDARKAFPCFDEPSFKSTFEMTIIHDKHMNATLSNMPVKDNGTVTDTVLNWVTTKYEESVEMVTYLVAIVVSDYVCKEDTIDNITVGVCASPVQQNKLDYGLQSTKKCLHHLAKDYLQIDYPISKVDMVAIPDFAYGAMENWGLVTFREMRLIWDNETDTSSNKMATVAVIAHELAHFWFGNLVTCQWWSHFWLNEGFATFMEYTAVNYSHPDWNYFDLFMISDYMSAVTADSTASSHPLVRKVESPVDVQQYSSSIVYSKGSTVIRMLEDVMGAHNFQKGIQYYLGNNSYKNAVTQDLLNALNDSYPHSELNISIFDLMDSWTTKAGFPYLNITQEKNIFTITQERFLSNGKRPENDTIWTIPLSYYTSLKTMKKTEKVFITNKNETITIEGSEDQLIKFNVDNKGMYFVNYPLDVWDKWIKALIENENKLISEKLTPSDRATFLVDSFFLSRAGFLPYVKPLQLAKYLVNEDHLTPWSIALNSFQQIKSYMSTTEYRDRLIKYFLELSEPAYNKFGWKEIETDSDTMKRLRAAIIEFVCSLYHKPCLEEALKQYSKWKGGQKLAPNLLTSTLRYAIRQSSDRTDWDFLWDKYSNENSSSVKQTYLNALSYTTDPNLLNLLLNRVVNSKLIRTQDIITVFSDVSQNSDGLQIVWEFYKQNYQKLIGKLTTIQLGTVFNNICGQFSNTTRKQEVENFFSSNQNIGVTNYDKNKAIETINGNIEWMNKHKEEIGNFLICGSDTCPWTSYRLNENIIPLKYSIDFNVDVIGNRFNGNVTIEVEAKEEVEYFIVHAANTLNVTESRVLKGNSDEEMIINQTFRYPRYEFLVIQLSDKRPADSYKLIFNFESELNQNMVGLYKSQYYKEGQPIGLAATQFQATHARKAFPCFDEPSFKSKFQVSITTTSNMSLTISNAREHKSVRTISDGTDEVTLYFEETVPMVTYLLALVVSDFECKNTSLAVGSIPVRVCSSSVEKYKLDYSLEVSPKILDYFGEHFNYSYAEQNMPKVDFLAIPDFSAGAMENWGLITFRETAMLWEEWESTTANKMSVIAVIAHEIAHMWFGNLVTCKWWSDLWLNEAFASYLEYTSVSAVEKDWNFTDLFLMTDYVTAISADSSATSHPIVRPVNSPEERGYTSAIVYQKGASVLRMLEYVMGDQFVSALKVYLKKYEFQTVVTKQLWDELNNFFPEKYNKMTTIYELMDSWTTKAGFPYVNVTRDKTNPNQLTVKQERFLSNGKTLDSDTVWTIPLSYYISIEEKSENIRFIKQKEETFDITPEESFGGLLKLNTDNKGLYFVNYPEEDWSKWISALNNISVLEALTPSDRTNLIIDSFYLSRAGLLSYLKPLELSKYLSKERHLQPWSVAISMFAPIRRYLSFTEHKEDLDLYLSGLAQPTYDRLLWDDSEGTDLDRRLRSNILELICSTGYEPCLQRAQDMYYEWRVNKNLKPNILAPALRYAIRRINLPYDWNNLWEVYRESTSTVLKLTYLNALAFTSDTNLIKQLLDYSLNETLVRKQDYLSVLNYVISNPDGLQVIWDYYRNNYTLLKQNLSESQMGTLVNNICNHFSDNNRRKEVKDFFDSNPEGITQNERKRALETIDSNINWINTNKHLVGNWLKTQAFITKGTKNLKIWSKHKNKRNLI